MAKIKCPDKDCKVEIDEHDLRAQSQHVSSHHPEIADQRRREAGFRQDDSGNWIDTLATKD